LHQRGERREAHRFGVGRCRLRLRLRCLDAAPLPKTVREIAWKAQVRLCARYRRLAARGKPHTVVTAAIARELGAFIWAIARYVQPAEQS
jgi:hypothetical protein